MSSSNADLIRRSYEEIYNRGALDLIDELYDPDYVSHPNSREPEGLHGLEALRQAANNLRLAFPDVRFEILDLIEAGDKVVSRWRMTGTFSAPLYGFSGTGVHSSITGITIHGIRGGRIFETWEEIDMLAAFGRFGMLPHSAET